MKKFYILTTFVILFFVCANSGNAQNLKTTSASTLGTVEVDDTALGDTATYTFTYVTSNNIGGSTGYPNIFLGYYPSGFNSYKNLWDSSRKVGCGTDIIIKVNGVVQDCDNFAMASSFGSGIQINTSSISISAGSTIQIIVSNIIQNPAATGTYTFTWKTAAGTEAAVENFTASTIFSATSGINNATENSELSVSPNPATNYIQISGLTQETSYTIYSLEGKKMFSGNVINNENIDVVNLSNGWNFIEIFKEISQNIFE